ncbi:hypothetical protein GPS60_12970 [Acinetobacter haemolyticus]|uniref:hypothetical protein n=1 Tax=Acinetobacter haemolyticus TaxID=29430 RepID=UPI001372C4C7|nr:hypothetical protein [Acinetobacter haemolyticus]NAR48524.1 hypothetical protein [Acinetobacter haemolyticus]
MKKLILPIGLILALISGCDSSSSAITSSQAVQGQAPTMNACKQRLLETAKKYNVSYKVSIEEDEYVSAKIVKDGIKTDLLAVCQKAGDTYQAMFEIPDEAPSEQHVSSNSKEKNVTEKQCVQIRNEWNKLQKSSNEKDWKKSEQYLADYKNSGCFEKCGQMVEDTDTIEKEVRCQ